MSESSDQIIKHEIVDIIGSIGSLRLRIFPQSSMDDQLPFSDGGLTFGYKGIYYGSCDAAWVINNKTFIDPFNDKKINTFPVIALEGTDALRRGSSGNAQYQRFHHALGAVKGGGIGVYYLRPGENKLQLDLYRMAYCASIQEKGYYLITQDLVEVKELLLMISEDGFEGKPVLDYLDYKINLMNSIWVNEKFEKQYHGRWDEFARKRSTLFLDDGRILKHAGRMRRNFTDGSQRAGHIAVGEMYLTKYFFEDKEILYLFPRMTKEDIKFLDEHKARDKEWQLLRSEPKVNIITLDNLVGVPQDIIEKLEGIKNSPLLRNAMIQYRYCIGKITLMIKRGDISIEI